VPLRRDLRQSLPWRRSPGESIFEEIPATPGFAYGPFVYIDYSLVLAKALLTFIGLPLPAPVSTR
jgi:hypothetical protein